MKNPLNASTPLEPATVRSQVSSLRSPSARSLVVAGNRDPALVAFESGVVEFFVDAAELLGVPKSLAAIYGVVFASPRPLSFADIGARLDLSKGSISQGLRSLREIGALLEVSRREDPAELFEPDLEMRRLVERYFRSRVEPQLDSGHNRIGNFMGHLGVFSPKEAKLLQSRMKKLRQWHSRARLLLQVGKRFFRSG